MATPVVTHSFVSPKTQGPDSTRIYGPQWNDTHVITGLENVPNVDTTNASNLTSGTVPAARLPNPTSSSLGGVQSAAAVSHNWINSISTSGVPALSQPAFSDISGTIATSQITALPSAVFSNPSASIGFAASNGTATTSMRSDATPALSHTLSDAGPTFAGLATVYNGLFVATNSFPVTGMFGSNTVGLVQAVAGGVEIPSSANFANHSAGVAGYARTASTANGSVGVFGQGTVSGSGTGSYSSFGANFVATNTPNQDSGTNTGFNAEVYGIEVDINLKKRATVAPAGNVRGIYLQNNGAEIQPTGNFNGVEVDGGGTVAWKSGFYTANGAATAALTAGAATTASSASSQTILLKSTDSGGSTLTASVFSDSSGNIQFFPAGSGVLNVNANITTTGAVRSSSATQQITPSNPTGTSSLTAVMMGLGGVCKLTPVNGTRIKIEFHIQCSNSTVANGMSFQCRFGTGTAPANGAAATGTTVGTVLAFSSPGVSYSDIVTIGGIISGLTPGTAYWFDFSHFVSGGTSAFGAVDFNAMEF